MEIALVMTVKNEERLLLQNINYHKGIGIKKIFIYFDDTSDRAPQLLENIEGVYISKSVPAKRYNHIPELEKFWSNAKEHHTARQCLNTYDALQQCKAKGVDWLISLDADELFVTSKSTQIEIQDFFKKKSIASIDVVQLLPLEVIARKFEYQNVMAEETLFKSKKNFRSKFDQIYRKIKNPFTNETMVISYWLGHTMGKAALNVNSNIIPHNVHRFRHINSNQELKIIQDGYILHYHLYDFQDFIKKYTNFRNRANSYLSGKSIDNMKELFIKMVNNQKFDQSYLKEYYGKYLLFTDKELKQLNKTRFFNILPRNEKAIIEIKGPSEVLKNNNNKF